MRIQFKRIIVDNFRSLEHAELDLTGQGIVVVKGINEYEDNAESNGSGKSSIFEALVYAIFEETSTGDKDVANRINNDGFCIILELSIDGISYTIQRQMKSNKTAVVLYKQNVDISCRNKTDTNKLILSLLNVNKSIFLDSIFLAQTSSTNLASLSPTARKERLETLTNTDLIINKFKDDIKNKQLQYEAQSVDIKLQINKLIGSNEMLVSQISDTKSQIAEAEHKLQEKLALGDVEQINNAISQMEQTISESRENIDKIDLQVLGVSDEITIENAKNKDNLKMRDDLEAKLQSYRDEYNKYTQTRNNYLQQINYDKSNITRLNHEIDEIRNSDTCPVCKRKYDNVNEEHINQVILDKRSGIAELELHIKDLNTEISMLENKLNEITEAGKKLKDDEIKCNNDVLQGYADILNSLEQKRKELLLAKADLESHINGIQNKIRALNLDKERILSFIIPDIAPLKELLYKAETQHAQNQSKIAELNAQLDKVIQYIEVTKNMIYLITTGFRTYLLQNSIKFLNELLASYSKKLFSNDKDIIRIEESDAKLNILLGSATYESLSGGEKTRVNIALLLAQKSLASNIGNTWSNIIILDEILGFCDSFAEERVINLIISELESLESIYMVSHKELPIGYDNIVTVVKNKFGLSHIL